MPHATAAKNEFSDKTGRLSHSRTYLGFCDEVFGFWLRLFNMTAQEQQAV